MNKVRLIPSRDVRSYCSAYEKTKGRNSEDYRSSKFRKFGGIRTTFMAWHNSATGNFGKKVGVRSIHDATA